MSDPNSESSVELDGDSSSDSDGNKHVFYYNIAETYPKLQPENHVERLQPPVRPPRRRTLKDAPSTVAPQSDVSTTTMHSKEKERAADNRNYEHHVPRHVNEGPTLQQQHDTDQKLEEFLWYWGDISRSDTEKMLKNCPDGSFLVKDSTTKGDYTLTVRKDGQSRYLKIYQKDGHFGLKVNEYNFNSVPALIEHYRHQTLADFNTRLNTRLMSSPLRERDKKPVNHYESLSALADMGRRIHKVKHEYRILKEKQVQLDKELKIAKIQERALEIAKAMFGELSAPMANDDLLKEENLPDDQQEQIQRNRLSVRRRCGEINESAEYVQLKLNATEQDIHSYSCDMNDKVEVLRDEEESCEKLQMQLLEDGCRKEIMDCLVEECSLENAPDQGQWLVHCSREEAINLLANKPAGVFLIRPKEEKDKPYALSIVSVNDDESTSVKHCVIHHPPGRGYGFRQDGAVFESIDELVCKHSKTSIKVYFAHMDTCLVQPVFQ